jgi:hypothetical protein
MHALLVFCLLLAAASSQTACFPSRSLLRTLFEEEMHGSPLAQRLWDEGVKDMADICYDSPAEIYDSWCSANAPTCQRLLVENATVQYRAVGLSLRRILDLYSFCHRLYAKPTVPAKRKQ